jgi:glutathione S-transferase
MPREPFERAKVRLWTKQVDESIHDASLAVIAFAIALRQQYLALPDRGRTLIEKIPDIIKRERRRDLVEHGLDCALFRIAVLRMRQLMDDIERALSHGDWLVAGAFSLADLSFVPYLTRLEDLDLAMMYGDRPRTAAWFDRCKLRPSYRTAVLDWNSGPGIAAMRKAGAEHGPTVHALLNAN